MVLSMIVVAVTHIRLRKENKAVPPDDGNLSDLQEIAEGYEPALLGPASLRNLAPEESDNPGEQSRTDILEVTIGDDTILTRVRNRGPEQVEFPAPLATEYHELKVAAENGNADAASLLSEALEFCKNSLRTESELNEAIDNLYLTRSLPTPPDGPPGSLLLPDDVDLTQYEYIARVGFDRCEGVENEQLRESDHWRHVAAYAGHVRSMYIVGKGKGNIVEGRRLLTLAWLGGEIEAAGHLGAFLNRVGQDGAPADPVAAYAYALIHTTLTERQFEHVGKSPSPGISRWLEASSSALEEKRRLLYPEQAAEATALAISLLESNAACCTRSPIAPENTLLE